jgi:hypothetical protein
MGTDLMLGSVWNPQLSPVTGNKEAIPVPSLLKLFILQTPQMMPDREEAGTPVGIAPMLTKLTGRSWTCWKRKESKG